MYKSAFGNRFYVYVQGRLPKAQKDQLRRAGFEDWVFDVSTDAVLEGFIRDHEEEIGAEVEKLA